MLASYRCIHICSHKQHIYQSMKLLTEQITEFVTLIHKTNDLPKEIHAMQCRTDTTFLFSFFEF